MLNFIIFFKNLFFNEPAVSELGVGELSVGKPTRIRLGYQVHGPT
jgi:hypothetical protein